MEWVALLPVKASPGAKSRLAATWDDPSDLADLVDAMRQDTLRALLDVPEIVAVVAVADRYAASTRFAPGVDVVVQQAPGLNPALTEADAVARRRSPGAGRLAVVGDLPAVTPAAVRAVLDQAGSQRRSFVADLAGTGTTMLAVTDGPLDPQFGPGSAARHAASGAVSLQAVPEARLDVDVPADLAAPAFGFGPATTAVLAGRCAGSGRAR